jgi:hypothetical protein
MHLLKPIRQHEFPADFLLARLKGRSGRIRIDWNSLRAAADPVAWGHPGFLVPYLRAHLEDGPWKFLFHEFGWVRSRMNSRLRHIFFPVFLYFELFNLLAGLRCKEHGNLIGRIDFIGSYSLLDDSLFALIRTESSMERIIDHLAQSFAHIAPGFERAWQTYFQGGFSALDQAVFEVFFTHWSSRSLPVILKTFLQQLVDTTNLLGLYKAMLWNVEAPPATLPGGTLAPQSFVKAYEKGRMDTVLRKAGMSEVDPEQESGAGLESAVYLNLRKTLKRNIHEPSGVGYILYYIWEQYLFARRYSFMLRRKYSHEEFFQAMELT